MADTGLKFPTATGDDHNQWSNPTNAYANNGSAASESTVNQKQDWYDFSFGVPAGATIDGIEVKIEARDIYCDPNGADVELSWNGGTSYTSSGKGFDGNCSSWGVETLGGAADKWGRSWSDSEFSDANFRIRLSMTGYTGDGIDVDYIQVKVYYTESSTTVAIDATSSINDKDQTSLTKSHTTGSGANLMLVFMATTDSGGSKYTSGITYDGDALTKIATAEDTGETNRAEIWKLENPNVGSANVVATFNEVVPAEIMTIMTFSGVDLTGVGTPDTTAANNGNASVGVSNTGSDGLVVDCCAHKNVDGDPTMSVGSGQTLRQLTEESVSQKVSLGVGTEPGNGSTVTMSWTFYDSNIAWSQCAVELPPGGYANDIDGISGSNIDKINTVSTDTINAINTV